ncbi:MAG: hypothetical protein ACXAEU_12555 [Candidatus Hodarchaeales archaeon]|jgi:hypothetical protein
MIKSHQFILLLLLTNVFLIGNTLNIYQAESNGGAIQTQIATWTNGYYYLENWSVQLEVSVWDENGQVVEIGDINVSDLNGSTTVFTPVSGSVTEVLWNAATDGLSGIHEFEITYTDASGVYSPSITTLKILIGQEISTGGTGMILELNNSIFNIAKGQAVNLTGNLLSSNKAFPYFYIDDETAFLSVEAEIEGNWRILSLEYPSVGITTGYGFVLGYMFPPWIPSGTINARCTFSGSSVTDLAAVVVPFTINLLPAEKSLVLITQQSIVERNNLTEHHVLPIEIQVPGYDNDPVSIDMNLLTLDGQLVQNLITNYYLTDYSNQINVGFSNNVTVGNYNLSATLKDANTGIPLAFDSDKITIIDDLLVDNFYWDITSIKVQPGQIIQGYLVSREEDTFSDVSAQLQIRNEVLEDILFDSITDESGYIAFTFTIPLNYTTGFHEITFSLYPLPDDLLHGSAKKTTSLAIQQETSIAHQQSSFLVRQEEGWFNATVVDNQGLPVETGTISLILNGEVIHESNVPSVDYNYNVPINIPKGINIFTWRYTGTDTYGDSEQSFPVPVYSIPIFDNLSTSTGETFPGEGIEITGKLMDETGENVTGAVITINHGDNWRNTSYHDVITDENGLFKIIIEISNESIGLHSFTIEFNGWPEDFYLPVEGKPYFEVSVHPRVTLHVKDQLVAGENTTLEFRGKPDAEISIEILENQSWVEFTVFSLDVNGIHVFAWTIPYHLKGEIFLRAGYSDDPETVIFSLEIQVKPKLEIQIANYHVITGEEIEILVSCSESHHIILDGEYWQENLSSGTRQFILVFSEPGDHLLEVVAIGFHIIETSRNATIQVKEDYNVTVSMPSRVQRAVDITIEIDIVDDQQTPLEGFSVELFINDTLMATTITSQEGTAFVNLQLNAGYFEGVVNIKPNDVETYISKEIDLEGITVYSVPKIDITELQPVSGQVTNVIVILTDGMNTIENEEIEVHLKKVTGDTVTFIGSNRTDIQGVAKVTWNVTQESGEYLLQVENVGSEFIQSITASEAVTVLEKGPHIIRASVVVQDNDNNLFLITAVIDFPDGNGNVYLCADDDKNQIEELKETGNFWTLQIQLPKGQYNLSLRAVDSRGVENWKDLGIITVVNDLPASSETSLPVENQNLMNALADTVITAIFMLPVTAIIAYKKRRNLARE